MRKNGVFFIFLLILLGGYFLYSKELKTEKNGDKVWVTYKNSKDNYSFLYPKSWRVKNLNERLVKLDISKKDGSCGLNFRIMDRFEIKLKDYIDIYIKKFQNDMKKRYKNGFLKFKGKKYKKFGENSGYEVSYDVKTNRGKYYIFKQYLLEPKGGKLYHFETGCLKSEGKKGVETIEKTVSSFKIGD